MDKQTIELQAKLDEANSKNVSKYERWKPSNTSGNLLLISTTVSLVTIGYYGAERQKQRIFCYMLTNNAK